MKVKKCARLIIYNGNDEWVDRTLSKSLNIGINYIGKNTITILDAKTLTGNVPDAEENNFHVRELFEAFDLT